MLFDFTNVWHILGTTQPPEITHFQQRTHPGQGWWLKTAVPLVGTPDVYKIWRGISLMHSNLVCFTGETFDWNQKLIPNTVSIWLRETIDIVVKIGDGTYDYDIVPFENSFNSAGKTFEKQLTKFQKQHPHSLSADELQYLKNVAQLMSSWHTDTQAKDRRREFKVFSNEKDNSHSHQSTKLDSDRVGK